MFHADGQTDMAKVLVAFRNFANIPKIIHISGVLVNIIAFVLYWLLCVPKACKTLLSFMLYLMYPDPV